MLQGSPTGLPAAEAQAETPKTMPTTPGPGRCAPPEMGTPGGSAVLEEGGGRLCKLPRLEQLGGAAALRAQAAARRAAWGDVSKGLVLGGEEDGGTPAGAAGGGGVMGGDVLTQQEGARAGEAARRAMVVQEVLSSDMLCKILGFLPQPHVFMAIEVCHQWRQLAGGLHETLNGTGMVNWAAFRHLGVLRQKKHSCVIKCQSRVTGRLLVVKRILTRVCPSTGLPQDAEQDQGFPVRYLREVALLRAVDHPHIMRAYRIAHHGQRLDVFSEFVGLNLEDYIALAQEQGAYGAPSPRQRVMQEECREFVRQLLRAVSFCHASGLMLRDMKPRNVMIRSAARDPVTHRLTQPIALKVTGLALGRFASIPEEPLTREVVTQCYRAPEILLGGPSPLYSAPVDIWSLGCTFAEVASGRTLFEGDSEIGQLFQIYSVLGTPTEATWRGVSGMPDFLAEAPRWQAQDLRVKVPGLCHCGLALTANDAACLPRAAALRNVSPQHDAPGPRASEGLANKLTPQAIRCAHARCLNAWASGMRHI